MKNSQILLVGNSHGHIYKIIDKFKPIKIDLICSETLENTIFPLIEEIRKGGITCCYHLVNPFHTNALNNICKMMISVGTRIIEKDPDQELYFGLTGGTNLMAIGAGISARNLKCKAHYVIKGNNKILLYDMRNLLIS